MVTVILLFTLENVWVLPKADSIRVFAEAIALITVAILEHLQAKEIAQIRRITRANRTKKNVEKLARMVRVQRRITVALLMLSCYVYIDATEVSPMSNFQSFFEGLPTPG